MAAIEIPEGYWTVTPAGFHARADVLAGELRTARHDVIGGAAGLLNGHTADLENGLALSDATEPTIRAAMGAEYNAARTQDTGDVLARYGHGDDLATSADAAQPPDEVTPQGPLPYPYTPGEPPPDAPPDVPNIDTLERRVGDIERRLTALGSPAPPELPPPAPGAPAPPPPPAPGNGLPTYDQVNNAYWTDLERGASYQEYVEFWSWRPDWREGIYNSDEAQAVRERRRQASMPGASSFVSPEDLVRHLAALDATIHIVV